ncbi:MAG: DUF4292 domain-containing protein [Paludibacteraceae bacterium]
MKLPHKILVACLILLTVSACKSTQSASKTTQTDKSSVDTTHTMTSAEMVVAIQKNQPAFERVNVIKMSVFVDFKGRQMDVKASCKLVSDSAIHLSIQPFFGVELFKLEMTPTSMIVIDKANRKYYKSNYSVFRNTLGVIVDYDVVQSLISNRLFVAAKEIFLPEDFSWKNREPSNTLTVLSESMTQDVIVDTALKRIVEVILSTNDSKYKMNTTYSNFKKYNEVVFPEKIAIDGTQEDGSKASFHFTIDDAKFDVPFHMEAADLTRYRLGYINSLFSK